MSHISQDEVSRAFREHLRRLIPHGTSATFASMDAFAEALGLTPSAELMPMLQVACYRSNLQRTVLTDGVRFERRAI